MHDRLNIEFVEYLVITIRCSKPYLGILSLSPLFSFDPALHCCLILHRSLVPVSTLKKYRLAMRGLIFLAAALLDTLPQLCCVAVQTRCVFPELVQ